MARKEVSVEVPFREAVYKQDRPTLNTKETQCVTCGRIFSSDSACETHKSYRKPVTSDCKHPVDLGMVSRDRVDGVLVWSVPMPPEQRERLEKMWAARRKSA